MRRSINQKLLISVIALLVLFATVFTVLSFTMADEQNDATNKTIVAAASGPSSIIDYIIENSNSTKADVDKDYHIVELGSSNTPSDLKKLVEAADYNFKNLVFNGNKSKNYTGTFNDNAKIDYKYFNACEYNLAVLNNADNSVTTCSEDDVLRAIQGADFIYLSDDPTTIFQDGNDISEAIKIAITSYATGKEKKPLMIDSHNMTQEIINLTSKTMKTVATKDFNVNGPKKCTYKWDETYSVPDFMDVTNMSLLFLPVEGDTQKSKWTPVVSSSGTKEYMAKVLTINGSSGEKTLTNKLMNGITDKYQVDSTASVTDALTTLPKPNDTYVLPDTSDMYKYAYAGRQARPNCVQFDTFTIASDSSNLDDLADDTKYNLAEYDFIIIEKDTASAEFVNHMNAYNRLCSIMDSKVHILYNMSLIETNTEKSITPCTADNFKYVYEKVATLTDKPKYGSILVGTRSKTSTYAMSLIAEGVKDIADIINAGSFRGIGGYSSDDSSNIYTVLEIQPCYPINTTLAEKLVGITEMEDPLTLNSKGDNFTFWSQNHKDSFKSSGGSTNDRWGTPGFYYIRTNSVLNNMTSDEISYDETTSLTDMIDNDDFSSLTAANARRFADYYNWSLSQAKVAHALDLEYNEVKVVHMSSAEFAASKDTLLDSYDMIYIGGDTSAVTPASYLKSKNWYSMYRHNGETYNFPHDYNGVNVVGYKQNTVGVLLGNDITDDKLKELKDYVKKGMPVVFDKDVTNSFNKGVDIDPDSNMYDFLTYADSNAFSSTTLWNFDHTDTIKVANLNGKYGTTYGGYATVFAGRDFAYNQDPADTNIYHAGGDYINEEELSPLMKDHQRPRLALTSMPKRFIEGNQDSWITSDRNTGVKLNFSYKVDGGTDGDVYLYIDEDSNNRFTETEKKVQGKDGEISYSIGPDFYGPIYWKVIATKADGTSASTTGMCKVKRRDDQEEMVIDLLEIQPPMAAVENNKCTLIFCTECQQTRGFLYGNRAATVGKYSNDSVTGLTSGFKDQNYGFREVSTVTSFADVSGILNADPYQKVDLNESNVPAGTQTNINNYLAFKYMNNDATGYSSYSNILGIHEHKFGIVKYYENLEQNGKTGLDDWNTNWFDELKYDYDVNMITMTTRQYEAVTSLVNSIYAGRTDAEVTKIKGEFDVRETDYKLYWDCMKALINGDYDTKISTIDKNKFTSFMTNPNNDPSQPGLGVDSSELASFKTAGPQIDDFLKKADPGVFSETPRDLAIKEIQHETDSSIPYDERNYYDMYSLVNSHGTAGDNSAKYDFYSQYDKLYQVWRNAKMYEIYFKNQYFKYKILSGINDDPASYKKTAYKNTFNIKDAFNCVVLGASDDFNDDDITNTAANEALLDYIDDEGNLILFHDTLTARGATSTMTEMLSDAFGQNARHLMYTNTNDTEVQNIVTVNVAGKSKKITLNPTDSDVSVQATAGQIKQSVKDQEFYFGMKFKVGNDEFSLESTHLTIPKDTASATLNFYVNKEAGNQRSLESNKAANITDLVKVAAADADKPHDITLKINLYGDYNGNWEYFFDNSGNRRCQLSNYIDNSWNLYCDGYVVNGAGNYRGTTLTVPNGSSTVSGFTWGDANVTAYSGADAQHEQTLTIKYVDNTGAAVSGETVTATNRVDGTTQTGTTDVSGTVTFTYQNHNAAVTNMTGVTAKPGYKNSEYFISPMTETPNITTLTQPLVYLTQQDHAGEVMPYKYTTYDSNAENSEYGYHGDHDMREQIKEGGKALTDKTSQINKGIVTMYPFTIGSEMKVSNTVPQSYAVDIEDPDVTVYYTLAGGSPGTYSSMFASDPHNAADNYFIYQNGSITYTGAGHASITGLGRENNDERRLFINIIVNAARKTTAGPELKIYDVDSDMSKIDTDGKYTALYNDFVKVANDDCDYVIYINDISDKIHFSFLPQVASGTTFKEVNIFWDVDRDGSNLGVYTDTKDYYIFQSGQNAKEAVDSGRLKRISTGIAADELVGENVNRLGTAIGGTTGLTLGAGNVPNLVLKDEYFDTDKKAYIVVTVTDSKGRNVSRTVRVQFKPELLDLN